MSDADPEYVPFREDRIIKLLMEECNAAADIMMVPASCIIQTKIVLDVLEYFGIDAIPLPVVTVAANDLAIQSQRLGMMDPDSMIAGSRIYAIGGTGEIDETRWDGHLVAWIPGKRLLLDPTLAQFAHPDWGIPLPSSLCLHDDAGTFDVSSDDEDNVLAVETDEGVVLTYRPLVDIDHAGWRDSRAWTDFDGVGVRLTALFCHYILDRLDGADVALHVTRDPGGPHGFAIVVGPPLAEAPRSPAFRGLGLAGPRGDRDSLRRAAAAHRDGE